MKLLTKIIETCSKFLCYISALVCACMMFMVTFDVILRIIRGSGMTGTYEIVQYMLCLIIYGGFAYCQVRHGHMHVTMFLKKMPDIISMIVWATASLLSSAMGVILTIACWQQSFIVREQGIYSSLLHIKQYPFQLFCGICMIVFAALLLLDGIKAIIGIFSKDYADEIRKHWVG